MPRRTKNQEILAFESTVEAHIAGRLRLRRGLLGMTQSELARALGITFQQVQKYERGSNRISIGKLVQIAEILDVPITFFFDGLELDGDRVQRLVAQAPAADEPGVLGRRDLDLLRGWRNLPPAVADAFAALLRATSGAGEEEEGESGESEAPAAKAPRRRKSASGTAAA